MAKIDHYDTREFTLLRNQKQREVCVWKKAKLTNHQIAERWGWLAKTFPEQRVGKVFRAACKEMDKNRELSKEPLPAK